MRQMTLAHQAEFQRYSKKTRREQFLEEMDAAMPWAELMALIEPYYPKGEVGRKPVGLDIVLRVYFVQQWFALSDPGVEDALYESPVLRRFAGIDLGRAPVPDETTILNFRHLLEEHELCGQMLDTVNRYLEDKGIRITTGTIVDATIIHAPSSTKNESRQRDPEMHQTKKGNQWYFGMKAHIGVDVESGLVHTVTTTAANVADVVEISKLLHAKEKTVYADAGYIGAEKREGMTKRGRTWHIAAKRGSIKAMPEGELKDAAKHVEHMKAAVRSKVEHPFRVIKRQFGYQKVRFKGLAKNTAQLQVLFALVNLWLARRPLLEMTG